MRFTTATVNASEHRLVTVIEVGTMLSTTFVQKGSNSEWGWSSDALATTSARYARSLTASTSESWNAWRYWSSEVEVKPSGASDAESLKDVAAEVQDNLSMGLGLRLVHESEVRDYRFDFAVDAIFASRLVGWDGVKPADRERVLSYYALRKDGWEWRDGKTLGTANPVSKQ